MNLNIFNEYKKINLEIINSIQEDNENIELLEKRSEILNEIFSLELPRDELKKIYIDMGLMELDIQVEKVLKEKIEMVKSDIRKLAIGKEANRGYGAINRPKNFFSRNV